MSYKLYDAEIEYLQSTGTQYINTGVAYDSSISIVSRQMRDAENNGAYHWGIYYSDGSTTQRWSLCLGSDELARPFFGTITSVAASLTRNVWHTVSADYRYLTIDNTRTDSRASAFTTSFDVAIFLFCRNVATASNHLNPGGFTSLKIKYFKITKGGVLVRDLIPVRVGNVGYMYDRVSGQLFGNAGTGSFVLGPDVAPGRYANEVAFLESWGNQYIDTGIKPSTDTKIELKCLYCKSGAGLTNYGALIGADDRSNAYILSHSAVANFTYGLEFSNNFANPQTRLLTFDSTAAPHKMRVYDEGGSLVTTLTCMKGLFEVNQNLYLFATNRSGTPVYGSNRILYCKIYDGDTLVRDYVPVEYNGIGYMYDRVSGLFFNNQGTGKFLFGSIAKACARSYTRRQLMAEHSGYERLSYISNEGHTAGGAFPYINLGIRITPTMRLYTDVQVISKGTSTIIHGVYSPAPKIMFEAVWNRAQTGYRYPAQANSVTYTPESAYARTRAQLTLDKDTYTVVRGGSTFTSTVTAGDDFKTNANFCLFFATGYQLNWGVAAMRMWSFKIWDNDVLIMDLVPVRDKSTKEIGLLNVVNHRFYGAVRGTFVGA